jgi:membrane-associated phospholipid phosphatase
VAPRDRIPAVPPSRDHARTGHAVSRLMAVTLTAYLVLMIGIMVWNGVWVTADVLAVIIGVGALLVGRGVLFIRDWLPFIAILLAWEAMRGVADQFGLSVHSDDVIAVERFLFFGGIPTVSLQAALYHPSQVAWYDVGLSVLYGMHFAFPIVVAFVFWLRDRTMYFRFVAALMLMALAGFVIYVLLPVAPPRFAGEYGTETLAVRDVMQETFDKIGRLSLVSWTYTNLSGNPVAAFPSLHAAFPVLAFLFVRRRFPRLAIGIVIYGALMWFAIVYLGHHYVVDILGGVAFAVTTYWLVIHRGLLDRMLDRLAGSTKPSPAEPSLP